MALFVCRKGMSGMFLSFAEGEVSVEFDPNESQDRINRVKTAMKYCMGDGYMSGNTPRPVEDDSSVRATLASDISLGCARMFIEAAMEAPDLPENHTQLDILRDETVMSDGLPFVMSH